MNFILDPTPIDLNTFDLRSKWWYNYFVTAHLLLVVPEDVGWRLGAELDEAGQVDSGADVHVQVRPAQDPR